MVACAASVINSAREDKPSFVKALRKTFTGIGCSRQPGGAQLGGALSAANRSNAAAAGACSLGRAVQRIGHLGVAHHRQRPLDFLAPL